MVGKFLAEIEPVTLRKRLVDVSVLIGRRVTTIWTAKELEAVRTLRVADMAGEEWEADVWALWRYYREQKDGAENDYRRRDVVTLLNNWPGDVAKCRQRMAAQDTAMGQKEEREHWARAEWDELAAKADARLQIALEGGEAGVPAPRPAQVCAVVASPCSAPGEALGKTAAKTA